MATTLLQLFYLIQASFPPLLIIAWRKRMLGRVEMSSGLRPSERWGTHERLDDDSKLAHEESMGVCTNAFTLEKSVELMW